MLLIFVSFVLVTKYFSYWSIVIRCWEGQFVVPFPAILFRLTVQQPLFLLSKVLLHHGLAVSMFLGFLKALQFCKVCASSCIFCILVITNLPAQRAIVSTCYIMFFAFVPCHVAPEFRSTVAARLLSNGVAVADEIQEYSDWYGCCAIHPEATFPCHITIPSSAW